MKFVSKIDFEKTRAGIFFLQSSLCLTFATAVEIGNMHLHIEQAQKSVLDPKSSFIITIIMSETVQSSILELSSMNLTSSLLLCALGITRLTYPSQKKIEQHQKRPKITNPWRPSV
jgi:hypothetical protein